MAVLPTVDGPDSALVAAGLTGVLGLVAAVVAGIVALRVESTRRASEHERARIASIRTDAAEVFRHVFVLQHEMEWLTWHAGHRPGAPDDRMVTAYEAAVHEAFPRLMGALAALASSDLDLYAELAAVVDEVYVVEGRIGVLISGLVGDPGGRAEAVTALAAMGEEVRELYRTLPPRMAAAMRRAGTDSTAT
jgi:hypothetical protein